MNGRTMTVPPTAEEILKRLTAALDEREVADERQKRAVERLMAMDRLGGGRDALRQAMVSLEGAFRDVIDARERVFEIRGEAADHFRRSGIVLCAGSGTADLGESSGRR